MKIVIIGAGIGGLASACRLQCQGHQVTVLDKQNQPGGRAAVFRQAGFTFDAGPTIITAPHLIQEVFQACHRNAHDYLQLIKLKPFYNVRFEDGSQFRYSDNEADLIEQIRNFNPADVAGYRRFYQASKAVFEKGLPLMEQPFLSPIDMLKVAPDMVQLQSFQTVAGFVNQYIQEPRLRQVFSFHPLLIGGNPYQTTSIYAMIHQLEQAYGVWFAKGGTGALVKAFVQLLSELGGELQLQKEVHQILVDENTQTATGVQLTSGECLHADIIISNGDVALTYRDLIDSRHRRRYTDDAIGRMRYSPSLFVLYFGTNRRYEDMAHHEILLNRRYRDWVRDLFRGRSLPADFSLYLHRPTATDPSLAPPGCDAWYVLAPVPNLDSETPWEAVSEPYQKRLLAYLETHYLPNLTGHIVTQRSIDPRHFRTQLNSYKGSAFSLQPTLFQSAWFRPHNRSEEIANLYFVGAGTHPGAGIPGVLSSAKIVAAIIGATGQQEGPKHTYSS